MHLAALDCFACANIESPQLMQNPQQVVRATDPSETAGEETMKIRLLLAFVGLATSLALPTFAQTNTPDPQLREALATLNKKFDDGFVNSDAAALAALYTDDAVHVTFNGPPIYGREAIQKHFD